MGRFTRLDKLDGMDWVLANGRNIKATRRGIRLSILIRFQAIQSLPKEGLATSWPFPMQHATFTGIGLGAP
jgi:hypothetical protein